MQKQLTVQGPWGSSPITVTFDTSSIPERPELVLKKISIDRHMCVLGPDHHKDCYMMAIKGVPEEFFPTVDVELGVYLQAGEADLGKVKVFHEDGLIILQPENAIHEDGAIWGFEEIELQYV